MDFKPGKPGDNVAVLISLVDRGKSDPQNNLGMIVHRDLEIDIYKTAVQAGVLNDGCSRNRIDLCSHNCLLKIKMKKTSVSISLCLCGQRSQRSQRQDSEMFTKCNCSGKKEEEKKPNKALQMLLSTNNVQPQVPV